MSDLTRLPALFTGPLAPYGAALTTAPRPDDLPIAALLTREGLAHALDRAAAEYPEGSDRRAIASLWSKTYLRGIIPAPMIAAVGGLPLDLTPSACALRADFSALVVRRTVSGPEAIAGLYTHLTALAEGLKAASSIAPRVIWSNAANLLTATLERLAQLSPVAVGLRRDLLEAAQRVDGSANPLFDHIRWITPGHPDLPETVRQRRICCIRDLIPGKPLCSTCPKLTVADWLASSAGRH